MKKYYLFERDCGCVDEGDSGIFIETEKAIGIDVWKSKQWSNRDATTIYIAKSLAKIWYTSIFDIKDKEYKTVHIQVPAWIFDSKRINPELAVNYDCSTIRE